ncbi:hypothetical protein D3C71_1633820 [compost metagenome]
MGADNHHAGAFVGGQHCADREAAAQRFRRRQHVRRDAVVHVGIQLAGATHAGLDFIKDQQRVVLIAQLAQTLQEGFLRRDHTALALHRLDDHRTGIVVNQLFSGLQIVKHRVTNIRR